MNNEYNFGLYKHELGLMENKNPLKFFLTTLLQSKRLEYFKYKHFPPIFSLLYDKINRNELFTSLENVSLLNLSFNDEQIQKAKDFSSKSHSIHRKCFKEVLILEYYNSIFKDRLMGLTLTLPTIPILSYFVYSLKKNKVDLKSFIFLDNNRYFYNKLIIFQYYSKILMIFSLTVSLLVGIYFIGRGEIKHKLFKLREETELIKKYERELIIYENFKKHLN